VYDDNRRSPPGVGQREIRKCCERVEILQARHPGLARPAGHIGFLGHGSRVEFRNIRVKELP
jgi:hypothetical protein